MKINLRCLLWLAMAPAAVAAPRQLGFDPLKQLVLDARVVESAQNARLTLGTPVKEAGNPLMPADRPWENATNNLYPNVLWDEQEKTFKIWYKNVLADKELIAQMDVPSTVHDVGWYLLYATSRDGLTWTKPELGLHRFNGSAATNIVARDVPNVGVFKDTHDPDPSRRYKMVFDVGLGKLRVRFSADGLHWGKPLEVKGFSAQNGDTHNNAFWDPRIRKYVWFTKLYLGERLVARFESDDFISWKSSGMVLRSTVEEGRDSQTYCLPVFQYGNVYLGYVMMYNIGKGRTVDCELAWSPDGVRWERVAPGTPFIPRGPDGAYDAKCIYAQAGPATEDNGKLLIYYGGSETPHLGWKRNCLLSLARLRVDGFAGYEANEATKPAVLTTRLLRIAKERITVSADAAQGSVLVELLDERNRPLATSKPLRGDLTDAPVALDLSSHVGKVGRLRFTLDRARLYAFGGVKLENEQMPPAVVSPLPRFPARLNPIRVDFAVDAAGWKGLEKVEHRSDDGLKDGYIRVSRPNKLSPAATSPADSKVSQLAGDWSKLIGGREATISFRIRASQTGGVSVELFAKDTQWNLMVPSSVGSQWTWVSVSLRYDWTDAQAEAAGWTRSRSAFSWRDTIRNVGRVHIGLAANETAELQSIDLDEVAVAGK